MRDTDDRDKLRAALDDIVAGEDAELAAATDDLPGAALSPDQQRAVDAVQAWLQAGQPQIFRLFGYAGVGKTRIARLLASAPNRRVVFAAYTGKAAAVMRAAGCEDATTIHSLIYHPTEDANGKVHFTLNPDSPANFVNLIVIDECSMVGRTLGQNLMSFGVQILVLGDPGQLPPIEGADEGYFTKQAPDILLTEIFRQAAGNPILDLAQRARTGALIPRGAYGVSRVIGFDELDVDTLLQADQILVGRHTTRQRVNARLRHFLGHDTPAPVVGEKLICTKNDRKRGLLNGTLWRVTAVAAGEDDYLDLAITADEDATHKLRVRVHGAFFREEEDTLTPAQRRKSAAFAFGYAITTHKAQGSQWNHVVLIDESSAFPAEVRRALLYTGITRAVQRLTLVKWTL